MNYYLNKESKEEKEKSNEERYLKNQGNDLHQLYPVNKMNNQYDFNIQKYETHLAKKNSLIFKNLYKELKDMKIGIGNIDVK